MFAYCLLESRNLSEYLFSLCKAKNLTEQKISNEIPENAGFVLKSFLDYNTGMIIL